MGAPVTSGRIVPVTPVPPTDVRYTGVSGRPLPAVSALVIVQPLRSDPRGPSSEPAPAPLVY